MQPCLTVGILVLQAERLVSTIRYLSFLFQTILAYVFAEPQEVAVLIGHLSWNANLVAAEVVGLLAAFSVFVGPVAYLFQGFVRTAHTLRRDWRFHVGYACLRWEWRLYTRYEIRITNF